MADFSSRIFYTEETLVARRKAALRRWYQYLSGLLVMGLMWASCGGPPAWRSPATPGAACAPTKDLQSSPKWGLTFGTSGMAHACLQVTWSNGTTTNTSVQPVTLRDNGVLQGWNPKSQRFDTNPALTIPAKEQQWSRRFRVFVLEPGTYDKATHTTTCQTMAPVQFDCFLNTATNACWFFLEFQPENKGYQGKLAPLTDGNGWCRLITKPQTLPGWPDGVVQDSGSGPDVPEKNADTSTQEACIPSVKVATYDGNQIQQVAYSPTSPYFLVNGSGGIRTWNTTTDKQFEGRLPEINELTPFAFDAQGRLLLPRTPGRDSLLWDLDKGEKIHEYNNKDVLPAALLVVAHPQRGAEFAFTAGDSDSSAGFYWISPRNNEITGPLAREARYKVVSLGFSPDGNTLAAFATAPSANGKKNEFLLFWVWGSAGPRTEEPTAVSVESNTNPMDLFSLSYHPSGRWLALGRRKPTTEVLQMNGASILSRVTINHGLGNALFAQFQPVGGLLAIGASLGRVVFYQLQGEDATKRKTLRTGITNPKGMVWRQDGKEFAIFSANNVERWACKE